MLARSLVCLSLVAVTISTGCGGDHCSLAMNPDGTHTLTCEGQSVVVDEPGKTIDVVDATAVECPTGGKKILVGFDNGAGGGGANDGTLEPGEVSATTLLCNGGCTTAVDDGGTTKVSCADGTSSTVAGCTVTDRADGVAIIACSDGTSVRFARNVPLQVVGGQDFTCGLRHDGSPICWGGNSFGSTAAAGGPFTQISSKDAYLTCGLHLDGSASCWGVTIDGQPPGPLTQVSASGGGACAIKDDQTVACWGAAFVTTGVPTDKFTQISIGGFGCGIKTDKTVACWGTSSCPASIVAPAGTYREVDVGDCHACAITDTDGTPVCWGYNNVGQINAPTDKLKMIRAGGGHSCGIRESDSALVCWGNAPAFTPALTGAFTTVGLGESHTCAITTTGVAKCTGSNTAKQCDVPAGFP